MNAWLKTLGSKAVEDKERAIMQMGKGAIVVEVINNGFSIQKLIEEPAQ